MAYTPSLKSASKESAATVWRIGGALSTRRESQGPILNLYANETNGCSICWTTSLITLLSYIFYCSLMSSSKHWRITHWFICSLNKDVFIHVVLVLREGPRGRLAGSRYNSDTLYCVTLGYRLPNLTDRQSLHLGRMGMMLLALLVTQWSRHTLPDAHGHDTYVTVINKVLLKTHGATRCAAETLGLGLKWIITIIENLNTCQ